RGAAQHRERHQAHGPGHGPRGDLDRRRGPPTAREGHAEGQGPVVDDDGRPLRLRRERAGHAAARLEDERHHRARRLGGRLVLRQVTFAPSPAERSSWLASTVIRRCGPATSRIDGWRQARRAPAERGEGRLTRHYSPSTSWSLSQSRLARLWNAGVSQTTRVSVSSPTASMATSGPSPGRGRYSRLTPLASTSRSPIRRRVRNVEDIPRRFLSRNSTRLYCEPTETMSRAPFSCAMSIATSWLVPGAGTTL